MRAALVHHLSLPTPSAEQANDSHQVPSLKTQERKNTPENRLMVNIS